MKLLRLPVSEQLLAVGDLVEVRTPDRESRIGIVTTFASGKLDRFRLDHGGEWYPRDSIIRNLGPSRKTQKYRKQRGLR